jgi:phosphotriesterase-related protein
MIQIAHVGDTDDLDYIERLLEQGVFIGMDRYGLPYIGREERQATVLALLERGYADRMVLGQDCVIQFDGLRPEVRQAERPDSYPTSLFEEIVPELLERGATQPQIDAMLGSTVGAWLTPLS